MGIYLCDPGNCLNILLGLRHLCDIVELNYISVAENSSVNTFHQG